MTSRRIELIMLLEQELDILEKGGYAAPAGAHTRAASLVFQHSLACINHWLVPGHNPEVCNGCVLLDFVPAEKKDEKDACRYIQLNEGGDTVEELMTGDPSRLEEAVRGWLKSTIERLRSMPDNAAEGDEIEY